jgi:hypothetical protein
MSLKPESSIMVGLATGALVFGVYQNAIPTNADIRTVPENNDDIAASEKTALWMSAAVVSGVSLIAKDATVFIIGGSIVIAMSWWAKHSDMVNPEFHMAVPKGDHLSEQFDPNSMAETEAYANADNNAYGSF